jgi:hypothetical protein
MNVRLRLCVFSVAVVALAGVSCKQTGPSTAAPDSASPVLNGIRDGALTEQFRSAVATYFLRSHDQVEILKSVRLSDVAFVLAVVSQDPEKDRAFGWLERKGSDWVVSSMASGLWDDLPEAGSNRYELLPFSAAGVDAIGGYVDPGITRIEIRDPRGALLDVDRPTKGASIILTRGWGQLRAYKMVELVSAAPVTIGEFPPLGTPLSKDAREVADSFVSALLSGNAALAEEALHPRIPPNDFLVPLRTVLSASGESQVRGVNQTDFGYSYELGSAQKSSLDVWLAHESGRWSVWYYVYRVEASG